MSLIMRKPLAAGVMTLALTTSAATPRPEHPAARISGIVEMQYARQHALPSGNAGHPVLLANELRGTNRNTGQSEYMAGGDVTSIEIADLTQGTGTHQGYITFTKDGDSTVSRWSGKVTTVLGPDQKPVTTFQGTWVKARGTGRYERPAGRGTYRGRVTSPTELVIEWEGDMDLGSRAVSR
jgi:hypothetical protein